MARRAARLLVAFALAIGGAVPCAHADVFYDLTLDLGLRDDARIFLNVTNEHFRPPQGVALDLLRRCPSPEDDYPVVLLLARASKRPPDDVLRLRLEYLSWSDVMGRLRVSPEVLFAGIDRDPGPPYGRAWGYWRKHPRGEGFDMRDRDLIELAKIRVAADIHHVSPMSIIALRGSGTTAERYVADRNRRRFAGEPAKGASRGQGKEKPKGSGKPGGHGHPHDHD